MGCNSFASRPEFGAGGLPPALATLPTQHLAPQVPVRPQRCPAVRSVVRRAAPPYPDVDLLGFGPALGSVARRRALCGSRTAARIC